MKYEDRLTISIDGGDCKLYTSAGSLVTEKYDRVVIGDRGPYVEIDKADIKKSAVVVPADQTWRFTNNQVFYLEYRTTCPSFVKIYRQKKTVDYADYKIGKYYISPFDLYDKDGQVVILS